MPTFEELVEVVESMILQHDYPGFEARSLKLGLPEALVKSSPKLFAQGLLHENIYVKLACLRWFQERSGIVKNYICNILDLLDHPDPWVRLESIRTLERCGNNESTTISKISILLKDESEIVRQEAAKACGKLISKVESQDESVISLLRDASYDKDRQVRFKAQKALRKIGAYKA